MITKVIVKNFKSISSLSLDIDKDFQLLVGQNNSGKTTVMQAINLWAFLCQTWQRERAGSGASQRAGLPISRSQIYPTPVRNATHLWHNNQVREKGQTSRPVVLSIALEGKDELGADWSYGMQLTYANPQLVYCKPIDMSQPMPEQAKKVFHLPPLSGIKTNENKLDPAAQNLAIGEGRPGEVLRNNLYELYSNKREGWVDLKAIVKELFSIELLNIEYNPAIDPEIIVNYKTDTRTTLEIASAGSGFLQLLLIATFVTLHEHSTLLIDEPDSHLHAFMKMKVLEWLKSAGAKNLNQFIIATHSSALVNSTKISNILLLPKNNHGTIDTRQVANLLKLANNDVLYSMQRGKVLWTEDYTDRLILKAFSEKLNHGASEVIDGFWKPLGCNQVREAKDFHATIRAAINAQFESIVIRDHMNQTDQVPLGMQCEYWQQAEIENYLVIPDALIEFVRTKNHYGGMFADAMATQAQDYLNTNLTPAYIQDPLHVDLHQKGSEFLKALFVNLGLNLDKPDYYGIVEYISENMVHPDITTMLDALVPQEN
jgi:predicted ATPase